jgi:hypothetical protein
VVHTVNYCAAKDQSLSIKDVYSNERLLTYGKNNINPLFFTDEAAAAVDLKEWKSKMQNILNSLYV